MREVMRGHGCRNSPDMNIHQPRYTFRLWAPSVRFRRSRRPAARVASDAQASRPLVPFACDHPRGLVPPDHRGAGSAAAVPHARGRPHHGGDGTRRTHGAYNGRRRCCHGDAPPWSLAAGHRISPLHVHRLRRYRDGGRSAAGASIGRSARRGSSYPACAAERRVASATGSGIFPSI